MRFILSKTIDGGFALFFSALRWGSICTSSAEIDLSKNNRIDIKYLYIKDNCCIWNRLPLLYTRTSTNCFYNLSKIDLLTPGTLRCKSPLKGWFILSPRDIFGDLTLHLYMRLFILNFLIFQNFELSKDLNTLITKYISMCKMGSIKKVIKKKHAIVC